MNLIKKNKNPEPDRRVLLVIQDGVGVTDRGAAEGNAVAGANMPVMKRLWSTGTVLRLRSHGTAVGMPSDEDMGNSEVGHNVLGCGRVFDQGAKLVSASIQTGLLFQGSAWRELMKNALGGGVFHLIGLLSDGNVHSHIRHLEALVERAKSEGVKKVRIHALLDGRDVPETSALEYVDDFEKFLSTLNDSNFDAAIASGGGRMTITMDRYEADWSMVDRGWAIHVLGEGRQFLSARSAIETFRKEKVGITDQYLPGFVIARDGTPIGKIQNGDSVVLFNFRGDRSIEISRAFTEKNFTPFQRKIFPDVCFAGMMQYDGDLKIPEKFLVTPPAIDRTLGEYMASSGIRQFAISETQKYGHVTYFWNGNRSGYFNEKQETYEEIPSDVIPFDQAPNMKAEEICEELVKAVESKKHHFLRVNFANGDMVGHTGKFDATMRSLEVMDHCMERLEAVCKKTNTVLLVCADHGNADEMYQLDKKGNVQRDQSGNPVPKTSHTLNPVNLVLMDPENKLRLSSNLENPGLANIAATILDIMGYETPEGYHPSLLEK